MSVRKRTLPSGATRWLVDYRDGGGARRFKQFRTCKEAEAFRNQTGVDVLAGVHVADAASVTIKEASELWLQQCRLNELEAGTVRNYVQHLNFYILPLIGKMKLSKLTRPAVEAFKDALLEKHSRTMTAKVMVSLKSMLSDAQRRALVATNMARDVRVKMAGRHRKQVTIPSKDEIRAMIAKTSEAWPATAPWRAFVIASIFTGLRPGELRGLVWDDHVDLDRRIIRVRQRADYLNKIGSPKSKAGTRDVPLAPMVVNALRQWRLACPRSELGLVFPTSRGDVIPQSTMRLAWIQLLKAIGLPPSSYRLYDLRHVAASLFIEQNWTPKKVMTVMGHSSIQLTFDLYGHMWATPESDQAAMEQIEARLLR